MISMPYNAETPVAATSVATLTTLWCLCCNHLLSSLYLFHNMYLSTLHDRYGRLDYAFDNAGIEGEGGLTADYPTENFDKVKLVVQWRYPLREVQHLRPNQHRFSMQLKTTAPNCGCIKLWLHPHASTPPTLQTHAGAGRQHAGCVSVPQAPDSPHAGDCCSTQQPPRHCHHLISGR